MEAITREEQLMAAAAGQAVKLPEPITRREKFLKAIADAVQSGGASAEVIQAAVNKYLEENPVEAGSQVYVQAEEPTDAPVGSLWFDTDAEEQSGSDGESFQKIYENTVEEVTSLDETIEGLSAYKRIIVFVGVGNLTEKITITGNITGQTLFYYDDCSYSSSYPSDSLIVEYEFSGDFMFRKKYNAGTGSYNNMSNGISATPFVTAIAPNARNDTLAIYSASIIPKLSVTIWGC